MGHHDLPRDYDAWRLSTPWDDEPVDPEAEEEARDAADHKRRLREDG